MIEEAYVLLDANILIDFPPPDKIDWCTLCNARKVKLVVYPTLRREISQLKDNPRLRLLRDRISTRETWLRKALPGIEPEVRPSVFLTRDTHERKDIVDELGMDRSIHDNMMIALAIGYHRDGRTVFVATSDGGVQMALEDLNLPYVVPEDSLRLPIEPDPQRQRADRFEAELRVLRNRLPDLHVKMVETCQLQRQQGFGDVRAYVEQCVATTDANFQKAQHSKGLRSGVSIYFIQYQQELAMLKQHFIAEHRWATRAENAVRLRLKVENVGTQTATDIRLRLEAPSELTLYGPSGLDQQPILKSMQSQIFQFAPRLPWGFQHSPDFVLSPEGAVRQGPKQGLEIVWSRLQQQDDILSKYICVTASIDAQPGNLGISYEIFCEELAGPRKGFFQVEVVA